MKLCEVPTVPQKGNCGSHGNKREASSHLSSPATKHLQRHVRKSYLWPPGFQSAWHLSCMPLGQTRMGLPAWLTWQTVQQSALGSYINLEFTSLIPKLGPALRFRQKPSCAFWSNHDPTAWSSTASFSPHLGLLQLSNGSLLFTSFLTPHNTYLLLLIALKLIRVRKKKCGER